MRRSSFCLTRTLLVPLLAAGLILTGCDSSGSNGIGNGDDGSPPALEYPSSTYGAETVANLLAFDLGVRVESAADNSESAFLDRYTGTIDDVTIRAAQDLTTEGQSVYGDIEGDVDLSSLVSTEDLARGNQLDPQDTPNPGEPVNTNELLRFYFQKAGAEDSTRTSNGIDLSQFAEKMILGTPIYAKGAAILSDFADGNVSSNRAEQWDAAFGYFGFPRTLEPFLDYSDGEEGLASGPAQDIDGDGVDLTSEYVHTWAAYAIERSAAAENNGQPNDFARDAFEALVQGREDIENGEDPAEHAQTALSAWEATVAVNVIHYINAMEAELSGLDDGKTVQEGDIDEGAWGEAKAFAWNLQFHSRSALSSSALNDILEDIGNDPPYGEMTVSEYESDLADATQIIQAAYGFNDSNVGAW